MTQLVNCSVPVIAFFLMGKKVIFKSNCQKVRITFTVNNSVSLPVRSVHRIPHCQREASLGAPQVSAPAAPTDKLHPIPHTLSGPEPTHASTTRTPHARASSRPRFTCYHLTDTLSVLVMCFGSPFQGLGLVHPCSQLN